MRFDELSLAECAATIIDNRGKTCPVGEIGMPLIATNCLRDGGLYPSYETTRFVSEETYRTWFRGHPQPGDLIFVTKGSPGRVCLAPNPVDFCIAQDMVAIRADERRVYPRYLFAVLRSDEAQRRIANMHVGTLIPHFKKGDFDKLYLPIPSRYDQVFVGDLYFDISARIDLLHQTNTTIESIAQALFKSWFIDFDPVRAKTEGREPEGMNATTAALFPAEFEESALGLIPKGWRVEAIKDVVADVYDGPHATPPEASEGPVFLGIKNLTGTSLDLGEVRHISEDHWAQWTRRVTPQPDDIVFSYEAALGLFALIPPGLRCCLGRRLALVRPMTENGSPHFWFHQFAGEPFQRLLDKHTVHGATVNRIALKEFPSFAVMNPGVLLRMAFEVIVQPLWARIHANRTQALQLAEIRDGLLPRLISGKLRLAEAQTSAELEGAIA